KPGNLVTVVLLDQQSGKCLQLLPVSQTGEKEADPSPDAQRKWALIEHVSHDFPNTRSILSNHGQLRLRDLYAGRRTADLLEDGERLACVVTQAERKLRVEEGLRKRDILG